MSATTVLFSQGGGAVPLESIASGSTAGQQEVAGLNMVLWSHTGTAYAMHALGYDPSAEMGITGGGGVVALGMDADDPGGTVMESTADGSQVGAVINTRDLLDGGLVPDGPMALLAQWQAPQPAAPFADAPGGTLLASLDLKVPFNEAPGGPGAQTTSNQIVLYLGLHDTVSGRDLAYGEILFDSRGVASPYFGADTGPGGTGAAIVEVAAGASSRFAGTVAGAAGFQGVAWTGAKHFALSVTSQQLLNAVAYSNQNAAVGVTPLSTDPSSYVLTNVSVDAESEYFGTPNSFSYSVSGMTVAEVSAGSSQGGSSQGGAPQGGGSQGGAVQGNAVQAAVAAAGASGTGAGLVGTAGQWLVTTSGTATAVTLGEGAETVTSAGAGDTVRAGTGAAVVYGAGSGLSVSGGSGSLLFVGGAGSATVGGGGAGSVLYGGTGGGQLSAGAAGGSILVAGGGNTTLMGSAGGDVLFGAVTDGTALWAGGGAELLVAGPGAATLQGGAGTAVMFTGGAADTILVGGGGVDEVVGFRTGTDHLGTLGGANVVSSHAGAWGTTMGLSDGTTVVMFGVGATA